LVVAAADVNLTAMTRFYQVGLVRLGNVISIPELTRHEGGTTDEVADRPVVLSPRNVYFAPLPNRVLAAVYPADRQATARWVRHTSGPQGAAMSPYLKQAADRTGDATLVVAVDLADAYAPSVVRYAVGVSPVVVKKKVTNLDLLAKVVASVKGLTLTANVTDAIGATIRVDFGIDPSLFKLTLKDLFIELVEEQGVAIPGLQSWEAKFDEKSMTLTGPLTSADLRRIVSLFAFPGSAGADVADAAKDQVSVPATQRYLAAVDAILADVSNAKQSPDYNKMATWHDKAAVQIEHLNRRGVDPIGVEAGLESARRLHAIAGSLRGVPIDMNSLASKPQYDLTPFVGGGRGLFSNWGFSISSNVSQIQDKMARVVADDEKRRSEAWSQIQRIMDGAKEKLGEKYKTQF
jgi:hypothetical protein